MHEARQEEGTDAAWFSDGGLAWTGLAGALHRLGGRPRRPERLQGIPAQLLHSIALLESGRFDKERKASYAWPWTVTAEGQGRYLPSKQAALAEVRALKARGVRNIDVGCMQINLLHHPTAFASLEEAFEPAANVAYAGRFLRGLFETTGNWPTAASYYHSQTPHLATAYKARLMTTWTAARERAADLRFSFDKPRTGTWAYVRQPNLTPQAEKLMLERAEARQIAEAYRAARLAEWKMRKAAQVEGAAKRDRDS
jgi:hypothetical protein